MILGEARWSTGLQSAPSNYSIKPIVIKQGWVSMKTGLISRWQRRYVAVEKNGFNLTLYVRETILQNTNLLEIDLSSPSTTVSIAQDSTKGSKRSSYNFMIISGTKKNLFSVATKAELDDWIPVLMGEFSKAATIRTSGRKAELSYLNFNDHSMTPTRTISRRSSIFNQSKHQADQSYDADSQVDESDINISSPSLPNVNYGRGSLSRRSSVNRRPVKQEKPQPTDRFSIETDITIQSESESYNVPHTFGAGVTSNSVEKTKNLNSNRVSYNSKDQLMNNNITSTFTNSNTTLRNVSLPRDTKIKDIPENNNITITKQQDDSQTEISESYGDNLNEAFSDMILMAKQMDAAANSEDEKTAINSNTRIFDWNMNYQSLLERKVFNVEEQIQKDLDIMKLSYQFKETSLNHIHNYIDNYHLSASGEDSELGFALKNENESEDVQLLFSKDGIAFSFVCNYARNDDETIIAALKNSSSELRAVNSVTDIIFKEGPFMGLHTALMALVDYKGFRMIALAEMQEVNVVYDLLDSPVKENGGAVDRLQQLGLALALKPHALQVEDERRATCYMSANTVVHLDQSTDWYYLSDLQQTFPADFSGKKDGREAPNMIFRLRPELLQRYKRGVASDAFTLNSGASDLEREANDVDAINAAVYLREVAIPQFAQDLDNLIYRPVDSKSLTEYAHANGINMRHLGRVADSSKSPYVKHICLVEIVARACKQLISKEIYSALIHFREVGATKIDHELCRYITDTINKILGTSEISQKYYDIKIKPILQDYYQYGLSFDEFSQLHKPSLFLALQYHSNVTYESKCDYSFGTPNPIDRSNFIGFIARTKTINGLKANCRIKKVVKEEVAQPISRKSTIRDNINTAQISTFTLQEGIQQEQGNNFPQTNGINIVRPNSRINLDKDVNSIEQNPDDFFAYKLSRHFEYFGLESRQERDVSPCERLLEASAYSLSIGDIKKGRMYAQASVKCASVNTVYHGLSLAHLLIANGLESGNVDWVLYRDSRQVLEWCLGPLHPAILILHEAIIHILASSAQYETMLEHTRFSAALAERAFNRENKLVATYYDLYGRILLSLNRTEEAMAAIVTAGELYPKSSTSEEEIALSLYFRAIALASLGKTQIALEVSQKACDIREKLFGSRNKLTAQSAEQIAKLAIELGKKETKTEKSLEYLSLALYNLEKVFNFVRIQRKTTKRNIGSKPANLNRESSVIVNEISRQVSLLAGLSERERFNGTSSTELTMTYVQPFNTDYISGPQTRLPMVINIKTPSIGIVTSQILACKTLQLSLSNPEIVEEIRQLNANPNYDEDHMESMTTDLTLASPAVFFDAAVSRLSFDESAIDDLALIVYLGEQLLN